MSELDIKTGDLIRWDKTFLVNAVLQNSSQVHYMREGLKKEAQLDCIQELTVGTGWVDFECTFGCSQHSLISVPIGVLENYWLETGYYPFKHCSTMEFNSQVNAYIKDQINLKSTQVKDVSIDLEEEGRNLIEIALKL